MFNVPIDKIIPVTNARAQIASLVRDVQKTKSLYVLTRGGKPAAVLASIDYIHNNSLAKTSNEAKSVLPVDVVDKKETSLVKPKSVKTEIVDIDNDNNDLPAAANNVSNSVSEKSFDKEQPVRISIK